MDKGKNAGNQYYVHFLNIFLFIQRQASSIWLLSIWKNLRLFQI